MRRVVPALVLAFMTFGVARADIGPPRGQKRVTLDHKITTEKEYPDYIFFTVLGGGGRTGGAKNTLAGAVGVTQVKLDPKTPIVIKGAGRGAGIGRQGHLTAVPKGAGKKYGSEKEFLAAVRAGTVEGQVRAISQLDSQTTVKDTDTRRTVVQEYTLEKIDPKAGIVLTRVRSADPKGKQEEESDDTPTALAPPGGMVVAGIMASLGVLMAGLWLGARLRGPRAG